jgi:mannosyltransferase
MSCTVSIYLLILPWTRVAGTSELALRLPSVLAMSLAAAGVAAIGSRLLSERVGLISGVCLAVFPVSSRYGQEARSYAFVIALAVVSSYLLVRALESDSSKGSRRSRGWWAGYSAVLIVLGWTNLMALLILPAHAVAVSWRVRLGRSTAIAPWALSVVAAIIGVSPLVVLAWPQRTGTSRFLALTSLDAVVNVPGRLTGSWPVLVVALVLAVLTVRFYTLRSEVVGLCLPWLVLPPVLLLAAGVAFPLYDPRYILFCVPPLALITGAGLDRLASIAASNHMIRNSGIAAVIGVAVVAGAGVPAQLDYRSPSGHVDNIRLAAQIVAAHEREGDAVLYQPAWWRQVSAAYDYGFTRLRDISLRESPARAGNFTGIQLPAAQLRTRLLTVPRVWLVEYKAFEPDPAIGTEWKVVGRWQPGDLILVLYQRR